MKRFLLGITVLSCVVGAGAVAAFYGHDLLAKPGKPKTETAPAAADVARDLTPKPIPLAAAADISAAQPVGATNPFSGGIPGANHHEPIADARDGRVAVDRYGRPLQHAPDDTSAVDDEEPLDASATEGDIPPADQLAADDPAMPATSAADPLGLRDADTDRELPVERDDRYPERTAAAEVTEPAETSDADTADPAAPRALAPPPARGAVDRYGRPLPAGPVQDPTEDATAPSDDDPAAGKLTPVAPVQPPRAAAPAAADPDDTSAAPASGVEGTGRPGDPRLSGAQTPTVTIEKTAPPEIQIGKPAKFLIKVRNIGSVVAHGVEVHDAVPQGTQLVNTTPQASRGADGELVWDLGTLKPGIEQTLELELVPTAEGEIGSVATLHFRAEASVRTTATKPMLEMEVTGPEQVMKGQPVLLNIKISNPGSGVATGIVLSESVPQELTHPAGQELEFELGTLKPGESRQLQLSLTAAQAGRVTNVIAARGEGNLQTEAKTEFEILAPALEVSLAGPKRRYLERNATHNISVSNPGTAAAKDIELVAVLPRELQFVSANNNGQFDQATHSVYWSLAELPPQETGTVTLTTLPLQSGEAKLLIKSRAKENLEDQREEIVAIEGLAALNFQLSDASDPIEVNGQTSYEVRVTNQGTKAAANVQLVVLLPQEMKGVSADGPARYRIEGQRVIFEPLKQLPPKGETAYRVTVQALQPGDLRAQVQISTDEIREPVTREESTRVYGDE
jgi:uncharacterized repeat protein (TIGR01451 family)